MKSLGDVRRRFENFPEPPWVHAGLRFGHRRVRSSFEFLPDAARPVDGGLLVPVPGVGELLLEPLAHPPPDLVGFLLGDPPFPDQLLPIELVNRLSPRDLAVELRLRERGLVALVVAVPAVAVEIDHDVALELAPEFQGELDDGRDRFGVFPVHVEDRDLEHPGHVGGVGSRAPLLRRRREPDLIVHDYVERAADLVPAELAHVENLLHHTLPREGGVSVDQEDHPSLPRFVSDPVLLRAHPPERDRVHVFEVAGVVAEGKVHRVPGRRRHVDAVAEVVFDVALA